MKFIDVVQYIWDGENFQGLIESKDFIEAPKILVIGMLQHGKSLLLKIFAQIEEIEIGDGFVACTKNIMFYWGTIKETGDRIILIDTPGLG